MKILKVSTLTAFTIFILIGLITIFSTFNSYYKDELNVFIGVIFSIFGLYVYFKERTIYELLSKSYSKENNKSFNKVLVYELLFLLFIIFNGLIILSGVYLRAFGEKLAVFG